MPAARSTLLLLLLLWCRALNLVRPAAGLLFLVFPVAIMDMLSGVFMCHWEDLKQPVSLLWPDTGERFGKHFGR
jgi:hypothetical protein